MLAHPTNCMGYEVFSDNLDDLPLNDKTVITTINQYSYCMAELDNDFKTALKQSDVLLPDGVGIVVAAKFLTGAVINKISGTDLHEHMLRKLNENGGSCFYLGSSQATLNKIAKRLKKEYPNIKGNFYSPPFKTEFTAADNQAMKDAINEISPDALFIGMTAPKQEKWAVHHRDEINAKYICAIGAVFDFYAGTVKRPGKIWINLGLEWLGRMIAEPRRLYKRYLIYGSIFAFKLVQQKLKTQYGLAKKAQTDVTVIPGHSLKSA
jgi:N-acetylglucosaminyldiphosphoundecaprenol N-acetyl-beta-D-mannosaminyltransferase